jgi:hypothetical protein
VTPMGTSRQQAAAALVGVAVHLLLRPPPRVQVPAAAVQRQWQRYTPHQQQQVGVQGCKETPPKQRPCSHTSCRRCRWNRMAHPWAPRAVSGGMRAQSASGAAPSSGIGWKGSPKTALASRRSSGCG